MSYYTNHINHADEEIDIISSLLDLLIEFVNIEYGLSKFLKVENVYDYIINCVDVTNVNVLNKLFKILSVSCFYDEEISNNLYDAIEYHRISHREFCRYNFIKLILEEYRHEYGLCLNIVNFINNYVNKNPELTERIEVYIIKYMLYNLLLLIDT